MSDFDAVLERLLTDPSFQAQLAADATGALAGYQLDAAETALLRQQVGGDTGAAAAVVEDRISKSSTFGLFSSFEGFTGGGGVPAAQGFGSAPAVQGFGSAPAAPADGAVEGFGSAPAGQGGGLGEWSEFGSAAADLGAKLAAEHQVTEGFGSAPGADDLDGLPAHSGLGDAPRSGFGDAGQADSGAGQAEQPAPPKGYHNRVDADGDGTLDKATYRGREGGGVEIRVDLNGDGRADFVGVDKDLDNRVDFADYDKDHDGTYDKRMYDDDGDGYLDRTVWH